MKTPPIQLADQAPDGKKNADAGIPHRRSGCGQFSDKVQLLRFFFSWWSWCFFNLWGCWSSSCRSCSSCTATAGCAATTCAGCCTAAACWLSFAGGFLLAALHLCWLTLFDLALFNLALHWLALDWLAAVLCFGCVSEQHCRQRDDQTEVSHDFNPSFSIGHDARLSRETRNTLPSPRTLQNSRKP